MLHKIGRLIVVAMLATAPTCVAFANDTAATLEAGGLQFEKTDKISMAREDLHLSPGEVRVRYEMHNPSQAPVEMRVAFPLPPLEFTETPIVIPFPDQTNFVGFKIIVDGKEVEPELNVRALLKGRDITDEVQATGLVVGLKNVEGIDSRSISKTTRDRLIAAKLVEFYANTIPDLQPLWSVQVSFHWKQIFKSGTTVIEHQYAPVAGGSYFTTYDEKSGAGFWLTDDERSDYCVDAPTERAMRNIVAKNSKPYTIANSGEVVASVWNVSYVLKTAANWAGPIGDFRLVLDGGGAGRAVSLCLPNMKLKRLGPAKFEANATQFTPRQDIKVMFVVPNDISEKRN